MVSFPSPCNLCSAICCKDYFITVTSFDVLRVAEKLDKRPEEFAVLEPARIFNQDNETVLECYNDDRSGTDNAYRTDKKGGTQTLQTRYDYLLTFKSHPCIFLSRDNRCEIFDFAPRSCRSYPLNLSGKMLPHPRCQSVSRLAFSVLSLASRVRHKSDSAYARELEEYKKLVKEWNSRRGTKERCWEFLFKG